ncbi:hypothetical protein [Nonomuraea sp. NPDC049695]|uniref:hypothetical protein n=1 Tax=Nonomuraea sp. NPDC049695 TaxID=3154734 RepID=UPI00343B5556
MLLSSALRVERWPDMQVPALFVALIAGVAHGNGAFDAAARIGEAIVGFIKTR